MNVALLHYSAPPVVGGVESVLAHHARLMTRAGHTVRVLAARGEPWSEAIELVRLPLVDSRHPDVLAVKAELDRGVLSHDYAHLRDEIAVALQGAVTGMSVLIAHNVCSLHKNLPLTGALHQLQSAPSFPRLILWHHDLAWTTPRYRSELYDGYPWDLIRTDWPRATHVVVSELRRRELAGLFDLPPERLHVVPNGVDVRTFLKLEAQSWDFVQRLDLLNAAPLLLLPVRLTPRKNVELALHALARLRQTFPCARLVVTGPLGPHNPANVDYFARLTALRADLGLVDAAHFLADLADDYLPDAVIADFYRLADALLLPSREEGFGIPMLEAAYSHLPVFCADIPPLRELGGDQAVYFSPDADPVQVAALVMARLRDDTTFHLAVRARRSFTWERIYAEYIEPLLAR